MKILYSHFGRKGKDGWGRSFYLAKAMVKLGHDVVFLTNNPNFSFFPIKTITFGVEVLIFPDIIPTKFKSSGFGFLSLIGKLLYSATNRFDLAIADCGHRPSGLPCKFNRLIYNSIYITEWWDYFGQDGYYDSKSLLFKILYGKYEKKGEIKDKLNADGVIVLSKQMHQRAISVGVKNIKVVHGGSLIGEIKPNTKLKNKNSTINLCYIGIDDKELYELEPFIKAITNHEIRNHIKLILFGRYLSHNVIEKYNLKGVIEERGWIDYLAESSQLDDVDIFVQIRRDNIISRAGWPNKLGDYLAKGKPIIIFPYGDLVEFTNLYPNGFIKVKYEENNIIENIKKIINNDYNLEEMGVYNRNVAEINSWEIKASEIINFSLLLNLPHKKDARVKN